MLSSGSGADAPLSAGLLSLVRNAARSGNMDRLRLFVDMHPADSVLALLNAQGGGEADGGEHEAPPLVLAARFGHTRVLEYILDKGADISVTGAVRIDNEVIQSVPAIWAAAAAGHFETVRVLVGRGANVNQPTATNSSALRGACFDGHIDIVKYLVEHGADVEMANDNGHTPLMIAAFRDRADVVDYLLSSGAQVNRRSLRGNTALHDASEGGSMRICEMLMAAGATPLPDAHGCTPPFSAALCAKANVVRYFAYGQHYGGSDTSTTPAASQCDEEHRSAASDMLKLLGATFVDQKRDLNMAISLWREALTNFPPPDDSARVESTAPSAIDSDKHRIDEYCGYGDCSLHGLSQIAYNGQREVATVQQLERIVDNPDAVRLQALVMRERIIGRSHPETLYHLRYRGAIYVDVARYDRCYELWRYALYVQMNALPPLHVLTQASLISFAEIFAFLLTMRRVERDEGEVLLPRSYPSSEHVITVMVACIDEIQRHRLAVDHDGGGTVCKSATAGVGATCCDRVCPQCAKPPAASLAVICAVVVYVLNLLEVVRELRPVQSEEDVSFEDERVTSALRRLRRLNPVCQGGKSILHIACDVRSHRLFPSVSCAASRSTALQYPAPNAVRWLTAAGFDVNARDDAGLTPLLTCVVSSTSASVELKHRPTMQQHCTLRADTCAKLLIRAGAHVCDRRRPAHCATGAATGGRPTISAWHWLKNRAESDVPAESLTVRCAVLNGAHLGTFIRLQCLAAKAVADLRLPADALTSILPDGLPYLVHTH